MKGWALIEYGGDWEDSWEKIVKIYLKKEKAEKIKKIMEEQLAKKDKRASECAECMNNHESYLIDDYEEFKIFKEMITKRCDRAKFVWRERSDDYKAVCKNEYDDCYHLYEASGYLLQEVKIDIDEH